MAAMGQVQVGLRPMVGIRVLITDIGNSFEPQRHRTRDLPSRDPNGTLIWCESTG